MAQYLKSFHGEIIRHFCLQFSSFLTLVWCLGNPLFRLPCYGFRWLSSAFVYPQRSNPCCEPSLIWQLGLLWSVDIIPLFLSMHPPNSCFFFSFSSCTTSSHICTFRCSSSPVCLCCLYRSFVEHHVSLVFFCLSFSFGCYSLIPILKYRTVTKNPHGFL